MLLNVTCVLELDGANNAIQIQSRWHQQAQTRLKSHGPSYMGIRFPSSCKAGTEDGKHSCFS